MLQPFVLENENTVYLAAALARLAFRHAVLGHAQELPALEIGRVKLDYPSGIIPHSLFDCERATASGTRRQDMSRAGRASYRRRPEARQTEGSNSGPTRAQAEADMNNDQNADGQQPTIDPDMHDDYYGQ
ncbi:hypothetical protein GGTG_04704 [Gaeumannomyces tritici R3-111a-1]|uniref:Uncharacterized protein n=1 Tax=Gaeumannomyces tritici (strain R3-111a-1) TaxID=644352 RepID=J3NTV5_GAET3|nr:hypothetical protein GGTG_04704 [Gaeumannomyces tritici R3-111a-1]EJT79620.1 hypothetical protein GGTG_04704 [Gaeumannomyces tritici R3-111a-1]